MNGKSQVEVKGKDVGNFKHFPACRVAYLKLAAGLTAVLAAYNASLV